MPHLKYNQGFMDFCNKIYPTTNPFNINQLMKFKAITNEIRNYDYDFSYFANIPPFTKYNNTEYPQIKIFYFYLQIDFLFNGPDGNSSENIEYRFKDSKYYDPNHFLDSSIVEEIFLNSDETNTQFYINENSQKVYIHPFLLCYASKFDFFDFELLFKEWSISQYNYLISLFEDELFQNNIIYLPKYHTYWFLRNKKYILLNNLYIESKYPFKIGDNYFFHLDKNSKMNELEYQFHIQKQNLFKNDNYKYRYLDFSINDNLELVIFIDGFCDFQFDILEEDKKALDTIYINIESYYPNTTLFDNFKLRKYNPYESEKLLFHFMESTPQEKLNKKIIRFGLLAGFLNDLLYKYSQPHSSGLLLGGTTYGFRSFYVYNADLYYFGFGNNFYLREDNKFYLLDLFVPIDFYSENNTDIYQKNYNYFKYMAFSPLQEKKHDLSTLCCCLPHNKTKGI